MLKVNLKKVKSHWCPQEIDSFIKENFFDLKTSDVMQLRIISKQLRQETAAFLVRFEKSFNDRQSILGLALKAFAEYGRSNHIHVDSRSKIASLSHINIWDIFDEDLPEEEYDRFWEVARKIADYKYHQRRGRQNALKRFAKV